MVKKEDVGQATEAEALEIKLHSLRVQRSVLLKESDWTQTADAPLTPEKKAEWVLYRQKLRDITENFDGNLRALEFPVAPKG